MENKEKKPIIRYVHCESNKLIAVKAEMTQDNAFIKRLIYTFEDKDITFKPYKLVTETGELAGLTTATPIKKMISSITWQVEFPYLKEMLKNLKKGPLQVIISYCIYPGDKNGQPKDYFYFNPAQWQHMSIKNTKEETENLIWLESQKNKYSKNVNDLEDGEDLDNNELE